MHRTVATLLTLFLGAAVFAGTSTIPPATTNNDDSCDIAWQPAATLLLPFFEVDFTSPPQSAVQTLFTIQNTSALPQIAQVTLWTDWAYPAYSFPVFLTGYDVQPFNLYDLFANSTVVSTSAATTVPTNPTFGSQPAPNGANPNFFRDAVTACVDVPGTIPASVADELRRMFASGRRSDGCQVGGAHADAIGYITIDVVATCAAGNPTSPRYFSTLLYDNVLTGDYDVVAPKEGFAQGAPLVHIRAVPEGGAAGALIATSLPYTFYDRYTAAQPSRTIDRRQPLPSVFAPRVIAGGLSGMNTNLRIWREGVTAASAACSDYQLNGQMQKPTQARFDEHENATLFSDFCTVLCPASPRLPVTSRTSISDGNYFARPTSGDVGGWLYLDLDNGGSPNYSASRPGYGQRGRASQAWVIVSMFAVPTYATETHAIALGNGCSPPAGNALATQIGPAPNPNP